MESHAANRRWPIVDVLAAVVLLLSASSAGAQQAIAGYNIAADVQERLGEGHMKLSGHVELEQGTTKLYADEVELFNDQDRAIATGHVSFNQATNTIAADRAEFNTRTRLGTFYNAYGVTNVQPQRQRPVSGGLAVPTMAGTVTDVYFFGDIVEKVGPKKYRLTNGGFSTCVQPTPRWDLHADTVVLNVDHYTLLKQAVFNVKGVPLLYVPVMYYPTKEDGRATGFLIPTYGSSSIRGQSLHNAFFWAINRSQDATFMHDWYSKTGQAFGSEYRYNLGTGDGLIRGQMLQDKETVYANGAVLPESRSVEVRGNMYQSLPGNFRARANVDYFSSISTMQTFNTDIYDASRNRRTIGANLVGSWKTFFLNGTFDRSENFYTTTSSLLSGSTPRVSVTKSDRPLIPKSQLYFSVNAEYVRFVRESRDPVAGNLNTGLSRVDVAPQIRYPFRKWQWFTVNSTVQFRDTFYNRSLDPITAQFTDATLNRRYTTIMAQVTGPVFNRIWSTPDNGYAEKFKHTIEPVLNVSYTTSVKNAGQIVLTDGTDRVVGTAQYSYGLNNRFYAKRKTGRVAQAQEIVNLSVTQSYYTNDAAAQFDQNYQTSSNAGQPSNFSPIRGDLRVTPATGVNATVHAEVDSRYRELRLLSINGGYDWTRRIQTTVGWTHKYYIKDLPGFNDPTQLDHYLNVQSSAQTIDNKYGVRYSFYYDVLHSTMLQQTLIGFYNSQCCGIAFQYSPRTFGGSLASLGTNRSFFVSFTLAGLGNFSPLSGAMSGVPR